MSDLRTACDKWQPEALALLEQLVTLESPSTDKTSVDRCSAFVETALQRRLGWAHPGADAPGHRLAVGHAGTDADSPGKRTVVRPWFLRYESQRGDRLAGYSRFV
jgi:hypothetical protein